MALPRWRVGLRAAAGCGGIVIWTAALAWLQVRAGARCLRVDWGSAAACAHWSSAVIVL